MRIALLILALTLTGCSTTRVLVKDCQKLNGMGDTQNCELVRKL